MAPTMRIAPKIKGNTRRTGPFFSVSFSFTTAPFILGGAACALPSAGGAVVISRSILVSAIIYSLDGKIIVYLRSFSLLHAYAQTIFSFLRVGCLQTKLLRFPERPLARCRVIRPAPAAS